MTGQKQLEALGFDHFEAVMVVSALNMLAQVPADKFFDAITLIDRCEAIGPITDPTFFVRTPDAWKNGRKNKELMEAVGKVVSLLPKEYQDEDEPNRNRKG